MIKKVIAASAATGGLLLAGAGTTVADTGAQGAAVGSPGVVSGNLLQVPIHIPINFCGNSGNFIGALNPAFGNTCVNADHHHGHGHDHGHGHGGGGSHAKGVAAHSPGVLSGNMAQVPVHVPVNACGNTVDVVGALNPAFDNDCVNGGRPIHGRHHDGPPQHHDQPELREKKPSPHHRPSAAPVTPHKTVHHRQHHGQHHSASSARPELARTGAERVGLAIPASAGLLVGGILLYRRGRRAAARA